MTGYDKFISQLGEAQERFSNLKPVEVAGKLILRGKLSIIDKDGKHWEDYDVEIHSTDNFPKEFPRLFETSGKIPRIADWHVYENTGSCCTKIPPEEILRCRKGITVSEYIQEEVLPYLFNQTHRRIEGYYINGEYSHGAVGIYEYYADLLNTGTNIKLTLQLMKYIATHDRPSRTSLCFCGQKVKFRRCHRDAFDKLKLIGDSIVCDHAHGIAKAVGIA